MKAQEIYGFKETEIASKFSILSQMSLYVPFDDSHLGNEVCYLYKGGVL